MAVSMDSMTLRGEGTADWSGVSGRVTERKTALTVRHYREVMPLADSRRKKSSIVIAVTGGKSGVMREDAAHATGGRLLRLGMKGEDGMKSAMIARRLTTTGKKSGKIEELFGMPVNKEMKKG